MGCQMNRHRQLKLALFAKDPHCFHCGCMTVIPDVNCKKLPPNTATIDHLISRINPGRWLKKKKGQIRRVLSCLKCNHKRSNQEILCLSRTEILERSRGFSLSPRGNPTFDKTLPTIKEVLDKLKKA